MAFLPTKEENGRKVLDVFEHFSLRPGHVLRINNFVAVAVQRRWEMSDLQQGLEFALEQEWIRDRDGAFELTESGFEAI
jgi:hypothetical protein